MCLSYTIFRLEYLHYNDVIMGTTASQITSLTIVYSNVYSDADQRKHQSSTSLAFVRGIHRGPLNSPHKWLVSREMFPFDDIIMETHPPWLPFSYYITRRFNLSWTAYDISRIEQHWLRSIHMHYMCTTWTSIYWMWSFCSSHNVLFNFFNGTLRNLKITLGKARWLNDVCT